MTKTSEVPLQTQLVGLDDELQLAINTLIKIKQVTGALSIDTDAPQAAVALAAPVAPKADTATDAPIQATLDSAASSVEESDGGQARALSAGESFGRYQISRQLGHGAMGAVYLAYDSQLERYVALKTPFLGDNPHAVQRFFREARSAARIRSPFVCPIYEVGTIAGILYLTMAYIEGNTLTRWIHGESHSLDDTAAMFRKVTMGVQKAHVHSIIHRDLKPDNIMVDDDGDPVIMDFGLARREDDAIQVTSPGRLLGTPAYMAPEQVRGEVDKIGPQSDIYSLGVVLYEMLTKTVPFEGSLTSLLYKVIHEEPPPPSARQPDLPQGSPLEDLCLKMMAKGLDDRYSNLDEVLTALDLLDAAPTEPTRTWWFVEVCRKTGRALSAVAGRAARTRIPARRQEDSQSDLMGQMTVELFPTHRDGNPS